MPSFIKTSNRKRFHLLLYGIFLLAFPSQGMGQASDLPPYYYPSRIYTASDGLSQTYTYRVMQDSKGYIWVATREGINKFDGLEFENHLNNSWFPDDKIGEIAEDENQDIWFIGENGLYKYNGDTIINYLSNSQKNIPLNRLALQSSNEIWLSTEKHIFVLRNGILTEHQLKNLPYPDFIIRQLILLKEGGFLLSLTDQQGKKRSLFWVDSLGHEKVIAPGKQKSFKLLNIHQNPEQVYVQFDQSIYVFNNGRLEHIVDAEQPFYVFAARGDKIVATDWFQVYKYQQGKWKNYGLDLNFISDLMIDKDDRLWITSEEGLVKVENEALEYYPKERGMIRYPWTILEDDQKNMWFASFHYGLRILNEQLQYESPRHFKGFDELSTLPHYTAQYYTGGIKRSNGDLLFPGNVRVISYNQQKGFGELKGSLRLKSAFQDVKEYQESLYLATDGLKIIHPDGSSLFYGDSDGLDIKQLKYIEALEVDKNGTVWMVSHLGMAKFDGRHFSNYYVKKDLAAGLNCVFKDHRENLWFGGHNELLHYDYTSDLPQHIFADEIEDFKGSIKFISAVDSTYLVLGMLDQLILLDLKSFYEGRPNYFILDRENGFEGQDCIQGSGYADSKGNIWVATRNTVFKLIPDEIKWINKPSEVVFHNIVMERPGQEDEPPASIPIQLDSPATTFLTKSKVQINFGTIDHTNPEKTTFQYRLLGYGQNWSEISTRRFALYSNLAPGNYVFEVRACLNNNYSATQSLNINIVREKWEALLLILSWGVPIMLFFLVVSEAIKRRSARRQARKLEHQLLNKELEHLKLRQSFLLNQASPHFTFNILNAIAGLVSQKKLLDAQRYIGMFGDLFRPMLFDNKKMTRSLQEEIEFVENYLALEKLRFPTRFEYVLRVEEDVPLHAFIPKMAIQTFVNNAIKHGLESIRKGGLLNISISFTTDFIKIVVEDNGIGRQKSIQKIIDWQQHSGRGIHIMQDTFTWFNDQYPEKSDIVFMDLMNEQGQSLGTRVELSIYAHYKNI